MDASKEKYLSFTTFKRDGTPVATAVWCTPLGQDRFGFWTSSESGKANSLAHTDRVIFQPSDGRGKVKAGSAAEEGRAEVVSSGPDFDAVMQGIVAKYGFLTKVTRFLNSVGDVFRRGKRPYGDRAVVVTVAPTP